MGLHSGFEPGYHFHRTRDWQDRSVPGSEVSFELAGAGVLSQCESG